MLGGYLLRAIYSAEAGLNSYYHRLRTAVRRDGRIVLLASTPKSGSTFMSNALARTFGYRHSYLAFAYRNIEQELYLPRILDAYGAGTVVQQHLKANVPNTELINRYAIRPVVLTRNIFDVLVSLRDHLLRERLDNMPSLHAPAGFHALGAEDQLDFVVDVYAPWLVQFFVSWVNASREGRVEPLWLTYEDCRADWAGAVRRIAEFCGIRVSGEVIEGSLAEVGSSGTTRMNKGVAGRGREYLSSAQIERVERLASYYEGIDFSAIIG